MATHGKNYTDVRAELNRSEVYSIESAVELLKKSTKAKFDETAEVAFRLGVDPKKSDQMVRGTVSLPHGSGKTVRVVVFATGPAADAAREAGATEVGMDDLIAKVTGGWTDFDIAVATPEAMKEVRKLGKVLGPRGLMPNPKTGTVSDDTATAVKQFQAGRVEFKMDRHGNVMVPFGKLSFTAEQLAENCRAVIEAVAAAKPAVAKGIFLKKCVVTSTMGPGLQINVKDYAGAA